MINRIVATLILLQVSSWACFGIVFHTDRGSFQASVAEIDRVTESLDDLPNVPVSFSTPLTTTSGIELSASGLESYSSSASPIGPRFTSEGTASMVFGSADIGDSVTFDFPVPVFGFAVDFLDDETKDADNLMLFNLGLSVDGTTMDFSGEGPFAMPIDQFTETGKGPLFLGVTSDTPFSSAVVTFNVPSGVSNFDFIQIAPVPEPDPVALLALVMISLSLFRGIRAR